MLVAVALFAPSLAFARPFQPLPIIELVRGCTDIRAFNYNQKANQDDGSCVYVQGNPSAMLPKIQPFMYEVKVNGNEVSVSWLSSFFSKGAVLVSSDSPDYALNSFGRVYNGDETEVGQLGGYELVVEDNGFWTYHTVSFNLPAGTWYVRPASYVYALSADYSLGQVVEVVID
jgi:hypothetical protein